MAWLCDESPVKANVELLSFSSSCLGPAALRSSPLQRSSERVTLRPAAELMPSPGSSLWDDSSGLTSPSSLFLLARFLYLEVEVKPAAPLLFCWPLVSTWETFILANSPFARKLSVFRFSLGSLYSARSEARSADPPAQRSRRLSALAAPDIPAPSPRPKTSPCNPVADSLASNFSSNSCARHLFPGWHDLQVISALAAREKQSIISSRNQSAPCHFGQNMTSLSIAGGRERCCGCREPFSALFSLPFRGLDCCSAVEGGLLRKLWRCSNAVL